MQLGRKKFDWQAGYFAITVSPSQIETVKKYVLTQEVLESGVFKTNILSCSN
jgi:REP element-mobilizing transposase RayT